MSPPSSPRPFRLLPLLVAAALLGAAPLHAAEAPLKLGVPSGTYGPDLDARAADAPKKKEPVKKKKAEDGKDDPDAEQLDGVTVKGKRSPASKLPTLGTDRERQKDLSDDVIEWYEGLERDPNKLSDHEKQFLQRATRTVDVNKPEPVSAPPSRESTDYADPIEAAKKVTKP